MSINKHFLNSSGIFGKYESKISATIDKSMKSIRAILPIDNVDIVIYNCADMIIPEIGINGFTPDGNTIFIYFDMAYPNIEKVINTEIIKMLAHESHHCIRWRNPGYGITLFEELVTEGLANHFQVEIAGGIPPIYTTALKKDEIIKMQKIAEKGYWKNCDHDAWFFGSKKKNIPKWTGYSLGYFIVGNYLKKVKKKAGELYNIPAKEIFETLK